MSRKILTVSVAAYNMEKYIRQCLESLVVPEILDDLEVFVIDDGGTDGTIEIAKEYAAKYPASFFPIHKDNGGWGSTLNYSIAHATGKYFKTLDGDDWYDTDGLIKLVDALRQTDADVVATNYLKRFPDLKKLIQSIQKTDGRTHRISEMLETMPRLNVHMLCYCTQVLRESGLTCPEGMLYTDSYYDIVPFTRAETILLLTFPVTCYRIGREGQSVSPSQTKRHYEELVQNLKGILSICNKAKEGKNGKYFIRFAEITHSYLIGRIRSWGKPSREGLQKIKQIDQLVRDQAPDIWEYSKNHCGILLRLMRRTHYLTYWIDPIITRISDFLHKRG